MTEETEGEKHDSPQLRLWECPFLFFRSNAFVDRPLDGGGLRVLPPSGFAPGGDRLLGRPQKERPEAPPFLGGEAPGRWKAEARQAEFLFPIAVG